MPIQTKSQKPSQTTKRLFEAGSDDEDITPLELTVGSWVAINYQSECGKVVKEYRGQVTAQDVRNKERFSVKFLTKCKGEGVRYLFSFLF